MISVGFTTYEDRDNEYNIVKVVFDFIGGEK